jgi:uncharacterized protein
LIFPSSFLLIAFAAAQIAVPPLKARVTDLTGTLSSQQRSALEQTLAEFEARKGSQLAVLMVPSTQPETVEQYAVRVQESWKLGRKGIDDGVLLLIAKDDRKLHIEVGYGLEGALPDAVAKRIIDEDIVPRFKQGDFYGGVRAGVDRTMRVIEGEPLPPPRSQLASGTKKFLGFALNNAELLFGLVFVLFMITNVVQSILGRFLGSAAIGGVAGFILWLIAASAFLAVGAAVLAFGVSLMIGGRMSTSGRSGGGWSSGGSSSGGGWSGGDGGFGGGGGSSGGGGASGSW